MEKEGWLLSRNRDKDRCRDPRWGWRKSMGTGMGNRGQGKWLETWTEMEAEDRYERSQRKRQKARQDQVLGESQEVEAKIPRFRPYHS